MGILEDKVIVLTGGTAGIGLECSKIYVDEGAKLVVCTNNGEEIDDALDVLGSAVLGVVADVSNSADVSSLIDLTIKEYGRIDGLHNNAGVATPSKAVHETTEEEWDRLFDVNLKSVYYTFRSAYEALKESRGSVLNTSSMVGIIGQEIHAAYSATKGAMNALTKSMALDYAKDGIRVNSICPAGVWTPTLRKWCTEQPDDQGMVDYLNAIHPLGNCPDGDVIGDAAAFLLSDRARFITGCLLPVSGGAELGYRRTYD